MKHLISTICLSSVVIFFAGCTKDNTDPAPALPISISIVGSWELRQNQHEMVPSTIYPAGNGNILQFTSTDYQMYSNGQMVKSGKYLMIKDTIAAFGECIDISSGHYLNRIVFDGNRGDAKRIEISSNNKLSFVSGCSAIDNGSYTEYARQ